MNKLFKGCKYIEAYVNKYEKFPEYNELALFYYNRYVEAGKCKTLPHLTKFWTNELMGKFNKAAEGKSIEDVIKLLAVTRNIIQREIIEAKND